MEIKTWCWDELWFSSIRSQFYTTVVFPGGPDGKASACGVGEQVQSLGQEETLEEEMATHSSILAWRIPWTEEPGGLQSIVLQRIGRS